MEHIRDLMQDLVKALVERPDAVQVSAAGGEQVVLFTVKTHPEDVKYVIGRSGQIIEALRVLAGAMTHRHSNARAVVEAENGEASKAPPKRIQDERGGTMTAGEKMVWAAVFAREMEVLKHPPPYVATDQDRSKWKDWEQGQAVSAAELACCAVDHLREIVNSGRLRDGFGDIGGVVAMATEMLR